jgi:small subunit ribosomal protein S15
VGSFGFSIIFAPLLNNGMQVTAEVKKDIFKEFGGNETNTGQSEAQVALFTKRIQHLTEHLKQNKKDYSAELSLIKMVGKRRALLNYIAKKDVVKYRELIKTLGLRK